MTLSTVTDHLQNDGIVVTANRRLARSLHQHFRQQKIAAGEQVWKTPLILPVDAWLISLHSELLGAGLLDFRLLDQEQSLLIWQRLLRDDKSSGGFLSPLRTATSLASAWRTLNEYQSVVYPTFSLAVPMLISLLTCSRPTGRNCSDWKPAIWSHCHRDWKRFCLKF